MTTPTLPPPAPRRDPDLAEADWELFEGLLAPPQPEEGAFAAPSRPPTVDAEPLHDQPRRTRSMQPNDWLELAVSAASAAAIAASVFYVMDWKGYVGLFFWWLVPFLAIYRAVVASTNGPVVATDRVMTVAIAIGAVISVGFLVWVLTFIVLRGLPGLRPTFFTEDMARVGPLDKGGGARHALVGSLQQVGVATMIAVPAAILTAIYLHEIKGRGSAVIRFFVDAMSGLPSIVAGLLVYAIWILRFGRGFSGLAAAAALTILMLPTITRTSEEILKTVSPALREAALALGAPQWRVIVRVVLPTARSGLITAGLLGIARAIGETAPLLLTASYASATNYNPSEGKQASLPMFVYQLIRQPNESQVQRAWTGALVLVLVILLLFSLARIVGDRAQRKLGTR